MPRRALQFVVFTAITSLSGCAGLGVGEQQQAPPALQANSIGYCAAMYGPSESVSYCKQRITDCFSFQDASRARLATQWDSINPEVRRTCVAEAQQTFQTQETKFSGVRFRAVAIPATDAYAFDEVESCVAAKTGQPAPAAWNTQPLPVQCNPVPGGARPADEAHSASQTCSAIEPGGLPTPQCISNQTAAKAKLAPLWAKITPSLRDACLFKMQSPVGAFGPYVYGSDAFLACVEPALKDWGSGR